jgi:integrase
MLDALAGHKVAKPAKAKVAADPVLRAIVLLGINVGAGNTDVANMQMKHLDLDGGWLNYPRGKTGIGRRVPLWPETVEALKLAIANRPAPQSSDDKNCVFLTPRRNGAERSGATRLVVVGKTSRTDYVSRDFSKLLHTLHINSRKGLGFYSLRHTLATIGLQVRDRDAVKAIMGHVEGDVLATYDEAGPSDERKTAVVNHVRTWLFSKEGGAK